MFKKILSSNNNSPILRTENHVTNYGDIILKFKPMLEFFKPFNIFVKFTDTNPLKKFLLNPHIFYGISNRTGLFTLVDLIYN